MIRSFPVCVSAGVKINDNEQEKIFAESTQLPAKRKTEHLLTYDKDVFSIGGFCVAKSDTR